MEVRRIPRIILDGDAESASHMAREGIRQLGILKELMSFNDLQQDIRKVEYIDGSRIVCRSCFGEDVVHLYAVKEEEGKLLSKLYVYVTISNYVTIWDLLTGEVATDICNNDGKVYDYYGKSLITFPCHKSELLKWLEGIKDKPTRQVLKDNPENNRDYLWDNEKDIGNENRVERANTNDPSYYLYFGVKDPCIFANTVQDVWIDTCGSHPYSYPCEKYSLVEKDTPYPSYIVDCEPEDCSKSFSTDVDGLFFLTRDCYYHRYNNMQYLEPYQPRSKKLYLNKYPGPTYLRPGDSPKEIEYSILLESSYLNPIIMESSTASFNCTDGFATWDWDLTLNIRKGNAASFSTILGDLVVDYNPVRDLPADYDSLYDVLHQGFDFGEDCFSSFLNSGICHSLYKHEARGSLWEGCGSPEHAQWWLNWCWREALSELDKVESESNRFGVSWCGSLYDYRNPPEDQTEGWYRVLLRFYMGGFHLGGHSCLQNWSDNPLYCPNQAGCDALPPGSICESTSWANELKERFSSVQATIELASPKKYPKDRNVTVTRVICEDDEECFTKESLRYKRPDDYASNPEDFTSLCAFPDRDCGYPEDEENNICYPFDGTYDIYTLGEAIEKLINSHYEDGSDDQLSVYLYERPNMILQSTG